MKKLSVIGCLLSVGVLLNAHPGIGIVKDSKGNIYYTDLKQVWRVSADGTKTAVVTGVHTHELYMDEHDNLYGEHLWYNGEAQNTWGHYTWCLKNNGDLVKDVKPTEGFLTNYSFVRDSSGNMYWVERFTTSRIMKKTKTGEMTKLLEGKFGFIGWLYAAKDGSLYFTENNKLHKLLADGKLETLAENIGSRSTDFTIMGRNYDSYGIWTDNSDNVYVAMIDSKKVIRIDETGDLKTVIGTNSMWTICSGLFDNNGDLWVLENSVSNEVRARKITQVELAKGQIIENPVKRSHLLITILTGILAIIFVLITMAIVKGRKRKQVQFAI